MSASAPVLLRAVKVEAFAEATPAALAAAVNAFVAALAASSRSMLSLSFEVESGTATPHIAYLVFTE